MGEETVTSLEKSANQGDGGLMPLENNLAQVGIHASFTLKGERVKSNTSWFPSASRGNVLISSSLQSFTDIHRSGCFL